MFALDELTLSRVALEHTPLSALTIYRFRDGSWEEALEVHRCDRGVANSTAHFWIQSVMNRLDYSRNNPVFLDSFTSNTTYRRAEVAAVVAKYDELRRDRWPSVLTSVNNIQHAGVMCDDWNSWAALLQGADEYVSIHWHTTA